MTPVICCVAVLELLRTLKVPEPFVTAARVKLPFVKLLMLPAPLTVVVPVTDSRACCCW